MKKIISFVEMKIDMTKKVIKSIDTDKHITCEYAEGSRDGYLEAAQLELQTLNQIRELLLEKEK